MRSDLFSMERREMAGRDRRGCGGWVVHIYVWMGRPMMTHMTSPGALTSGTLCTGVLAPFLGPPTGIKNMPKPVKRLSLVRVVGGHTKSGAASAE